MRYSFANCVLDIDRHELIRGGAVQPIEPQVFDLLHLLVRNAGQLVSRDQIVAEVWSGRIVSESAISARIAAARKAVGDDGKRQSVIRTVARRGLQCVAKVETDGPAPAAAQPEPRQTIRFARAADGTRLAYAVTGAGAPVIHTGHFPTNLELDWQEPAERAIFDALTAGNTLVRYDQRGCGLSDHTLTEVDFDVIADDLLRVADAAGLDRFTVFGRSGGSLTAQYVAAKHPDRVSRLMLLGGYVDGRSRRDAERTEDHEAITSMMREGWNTPGSGFVTAYLTAYFPDAPADFIHRYAEIVQASCPVENVLIHRKAINTVATARLLERITAPTLVMHARHDAVHPLSEGRKLATGIANAELVVFDTANHYPVPDTPVWPEFISVMRGFLDR